jgi:hypothetical protein
MKNNCSTFQAAVLLQLEIIGLELRRYVHRLYCPYVATVLPPCCQPPLDALCSTGKS